MCKNTVSAVFAALAFFMTLPAASSAFLPSVAAVKGRAFAAEILTRVLYQRASTAEEDPQAKPEAPDDSVVKDDLVVADAVGPRANPGPRPPSSQVQAAPKPAEIIWTPIPGPGKKCPIDDTYYFKYEFSERPKMGMVILKVQVFDKRNDQVVPFKATGRSDMPSMRGAHDSGDVEFKMNKKNDYLLPVNLVMPGGWEIRVIFRLNDKAVFHGSIRFDV